MPKLVGFSKSLQYFILARRESSIYRAVGEWINNINRFNLALCVCACPVLPPSLQANSRFDSQQQQAFPNVYHQMFL